MDSEPERSDDMPLPPAAALSDPFAKRASLVTKFSSLLRMVEEMAATFAASIEFRPPASAESYM